MKEKGLVLILCVLFLFAALPVGAADMVSYPVSDLDMSLELPASYNYVFTREISDDDPILADWGMSKSDLFDNDAVYLEALTEDQNDEVILLMTRTDSSETYEDFNAFSREELMELAEYTHTVVANNKATNVAYSKYDIFEDQSQVPFLKATGRFESDDTHGGVIQYVTVLNGNIYTLTFNFYGDDDISKKEAVMTEDVVASIHFDKVSSVDRENDNIIYMIIIAVLVVIIVILLVIIRRQKYSIRGGEKNHAEKTNEE